MKRQLFLALAVAVCAVAQSAPDPGPEEIERIIRKVAEKETEFARARENYTYRQRYRFDELGPDRRPVGKLEMEADIVFDKSGKRIERITYAPMNTLRNIIFTPEDEQDMRNVQPFVFTVKELPNYRVRYLGRERLDEIDCYVFAVKPKSMVEGQRYFSGIVWVDDRDLQIVKTYGRGVGTGKRVAGQRFPKFETWREQIDGKYWFPTYTVSNDVLNFESGSIPIKLVITYRDYKQFKAETVITYEGVDEPSAEPPKPPAKKQE